MPLQYQIGDTGPGGGLIYSVPGSIFNNTNLTFEAGPKDLCKTAGPEIMRTATTAGSGGHYLELVNANEEGGCQQPKPVFQEWRQVNQFGWKNDWDCENKYGIAQTCDCGTGAEWGIPNLTTTPVHQIGSGNSNPSRQGSYAGNNLNMRLGIGHANTIAILNAQPQPVNPTHKIAARLCDDYVNNGHNDWYLGSKDEMSLLVHALRINDPAAFNRLQTDFGPFPLCFDPLGSIQSSGPQYSGGDPANLCTQWTSSHHWKDNYAWTANTWSGADTDGTGNVAYKRKCHAYKVRPIRSFVDNGLTGSTIVINEPPEYNYRDGAVSVSHNPRWTPLVTQLQIPPQKLKQHQNP